MGDSAPTAEEAVWHGADLPGEGEQRGCRLGCQVSEAFHDDQVSFEFAQRTSRDEDELPPFRITAPCRSLRDVRRNADRRPAWLRRQAAAHLGGQGLCGFVPKDRWMNGFLPALEAFMGPLIPESMN